MILDIIILLNNVYQSDIKMVGRCTQNEFVIHLPKHYKRLRQHYVLGAFYLWFSCV